MHRIPKRVRPLINFLLILLILSLYFNVFLFNQLKIRVSPKKTKNDNQPQMHQNLSACPSGDALPFPTPSHFRQHHRCNFEIIPYVVTELASAELLFYTNYSLVRFGDLDMDLMRGISWPNQNASVELSRALLEVIDNPLPNLHFGTYDPFSSQSRAPFHHHNFLLDNDQYRLFLLKHLKSDTEYLSTLITSPYILNANSSCMLVSKIYKTLRKIWKDKDVIILRGANGQVYKYDVYDTAKSQKVFYAPRYQAWSAYSKLKETLMNEDPNSLYILSAGPVAKVLTYDLVRAGRRALDLGHLAKDYNMFKQNETVKGSFFVD